MNWPAGASACWSGVPCREHQKLHGEDDAELGFAAHHAGVGFCGFRETFIFAMAVPSFASDFFAAPSPYAFQ